MPAAYEILTTKKFLDADGLAHFAQKLNNYPTNDVIAAVVDGVQDALDEKADADTIGAADGIASLDSTGKVPVTQLPSDVNDVLAYSSYSAFPVTGTIGKLYIDTATSNTYYWTGSAYIIVGGRVITNAEIDALFV